MEEDLFCMKMFILFKFVGFSFISGKKRPPKAHNALDFGEPVISFRIPTCTPPAFNTQFRSQHGHYDFQQKLSVVGPSWTLDPSKEAVNSNMKHTKNKFAV